MRKTMLMLASSFLVGAAAYAQTQAWEWVLEPKFATPVNIAYDPETFEEIVKFAPSELKDGLILVESGHIPNTPQTYGFIDKTGKWLIPMQFDVPIVEEMPPLGFSEGFAPVLQNGQWGFIDKTGKMAIQPRFELVNAFSQGLAAARRDGKWGFIDKTGNWVVQPRFEEASPFGANNLSLVSAGEQHGAIDKTGKWVIQPQEYALFPLGGFIQTVKKEVFINEEFVLYFGAMDASGKTILPAEYYDVRALSEDRLMSCAETCGLVDQLGNKVGAQQFQEIRAFSEGFAPANQNGKWGVIDKAGNWVVQPRFEEVAGFSEGFAPAKQNGKWGVIDKTGNWAIQPNLYDIKAFSNGLAVAYNERSCGLIDKTGKWVIQPQFRYMHAYGNGFFAAATNESMGFLRLKSAK